MVFPILAPHENIAPHYGIFTVIGGYTDRNWGLLGAI